jgi:hypothetical protein
MTETHLRSHHVQISRVVTLQPTSTTLTWWIRYFSSAGI